RVICPLPGSSRDPSESFVPPGGKGFALLDERLPNIRLAPFCGSSQAKHERPPETELVETADGSLRRADTGHFFVGQIFGPRRRAASVVQEHPEAAVAHEAQSTDEQDRELVAVSTDRICLGLSR